MKFKPGDIVIRHTDNHLEVEVGREYEVEGHDGGRQLILKGMRGAHLEDMFYLAEASIVDKILTKYSK